MSKELEKKLKDIKFIKQELLNCPEGGFLEWILVKELYEITSSIQLAKEKED